ncbi:MULTISPECIES: hypothetical protein [Saccharopolyspora]|uniref:Uncharacterized protein n=1 Tax=Saccharopolyspora cebuensis TaxID=418759 RepID=A0ABV4CEQ3_9PSEU
MRPLSRAALVGALALPLALSSAGLASASGGWDWTNTEICKILSCNHLNHEHSENHEHEEVNIAGIS